MEGCVLVIIFVWMFFCVFLVLMECLVFDVVDCVDFCSVYSFVCDVFVQCGWLVVIDVISVDCVFKDLWECDGKIGLFGKIDLSFGYW